MQDAGRSVMRQMSDQRSPGAINDRQERPAVARNTQNRSVPNTQTHECRIPFCSKSCWGLFWEWGLFPQILWSRQIASAHFLWPCIVGTTMIPQQSINQKLSLGSTRRFHIYIYIYMRVVIYCNIALYIKLSLLDDLLIPLTLLTDFLLFCVLSFSGETVKRGIGESEKQIQHLMRLWFACLSLASLRKLWFPWGFRDFLRDFVIT